MVFRLFRRPKSEPAFEASSEGRLVYAVGDVHGRADLLIDLLELIVRDCSNAPRRAENRPHLVFLGDYIDRGPSSRQVVDIVLELAGSSYFEICALKGNHEEALSNFLVDPAFGPPWLAHGGDMTLRSYGIEPLAGTAPLARWVELQAAFAEPLPTSHAIFFDSLELIHCVGDYVFVHAGIKPGVRLDRQAPTDLLWIREPFLSHSRPSDKMIVHGHTPTNEPYRDAHRIGVDTGAYATGILTAARILDGDVQFLRARAGTID